MAPRLTQIAQVARRAEQEGYESIWVSDHLLVPESGGRLPAIEIMEPIATLAYAAALTSRIKLATSVIVVPYRNAIHLAKELATLDRLSSGRVVAGVASGWLEAEFRALGAPFEKRGAYTDEAIKLMRAMWSSAVPEFHGEFFDRGGHALRPASRRRQHPDLGRRHQPPRSSPRRRAGRRMAWDADESRSGRRANRMDSRNRRAPRAAASTEFSISHRVYIGFASKWTDTGGYVEGILAPPAEIADYLNRFAAIGVDEMLITPLGEHRSSPSRSKNSSTASTPKSAPSSPEYPADLPVMRTLGTLVSLSQAM